jgi:hypothetical protein
MGMSPARKTLARLAVVLGAAACGSDSPSPITPSSASSATSYTLSGTVRRESGEPLHQALIHLNPSELNSPRVLSDAAGRYSISVRNEHRTTHQLTVGRDGYVPQQWELRAFVGDVVRDFRLRPGVHLSGQTSEAQGSPIEGVRVEVLSGPDAGLSRVSGATGLFFFGYVTPGHLNLRASKAGYTTVESQVDATTFLGLVRFTLGRSEALP